MLFVALVRESVAWLGFSVLLGANRDLTADKARPDRRGGDECQNSCMARFSDKRRTMERQDEDRG